MPTTPGSSPASAEESSTTGSLVHEAHLLELFFVTFHLDPETIISFDETYF